MYQSQLFPITQTFVRGLVLLTCISRTSSLRGENNQFASKLFLSYTRPHKPVASATIARWLKSVLSEAGVDTNM